MNAPGSGRATLLAFAFGLTFLSSFGQTFFIGLFGDSLRAEIGLSHGGLGAVYSLATLGSALCMVWAGALIDRFSLPAFATAALLLLAAGCLLMATAAHAAWLAAAVLLLRLGGQGLLTHTAVTSVARAFSERRGRSIALALLGHPVGEAVLPPLAVLAVGVIGWRSTWLAATAILLLATPILIAAARRWSRTPSSTGGETASARPVGLSGATRGDVLRDRRFYLLLPTILLPGFVVTGVFIHQGRFVAEKGWQPAWFAAGFAIYAAAQVVGTLGAGPLIDRLTAARLMPYYLLPLALACLVVALDDHPGLLVPFMIGAGFTAGAAASIVTAMLAETWGLAHLGAVRALGASLMVLSTAAAPILFGMLIEVGVPFDRMLPASALAAVAAAGAAAAARRG